MTEPPPLHRRVLRGAAWSTVSTVVGIPVGLASTLIVARALGAGGFGRLALYTFVTGLVTSLSELGLGQALQQRGAHALGRGDEDEVVRTARAGLCLGLLRLPVIVGIGFLVLPGVVAPVLFGVGMVSTLAFIGPSYYLTATSDIAYASRIRLLATLLVAVGSCTAALATRRADVTFGVAAIATNMTTVLLVFGVPREHRRAVLLPAPLRLTAGDVRFGLANFANGQLVGFVFSRSELLFFPAGAAIGRGTFAAAQTIAARSTLVLDGLFGALPTAMSTAAGSGPEALERAFRRVSATVLVLIAAFGPLLAVAVVSLAAPALGHGYPDVAPLALAMTVVSLAQTGAEPLNLLRYAQRQVRPMMLAGLAAAVTDLAAAALLVPRWDASGAATANAVSGLVFIVLTIGLFFRDRDWRRPAQEHAGRLAGAILVSAAAGVITLFVADTAAVRLAAGFFLAVAGSVALLTVPRLRPPTDDVASVVGSVLALLPARLVRPLRR